MSPKKYLNAEKSENMLYIVYLTTKKPAKEERSGVYTLQN